MEINKLEFFDRDGNNLNLSLNEDNVWVGHIYVEPISVSLYDSIQIFILEKTTDGYKYPTPDSESFIQARWRQQPEGFSLYEILVDSETNMQYIKKLERLKVDYESTLDNLVYPLDINVAFAPVIETSYTEWLDIYHGSTLIASIKLYGEGIDEDERFTIWCRNMGIRLNKTDALLVKEYDIREANPDWEIINTKRKELLVTRDQIFPYVGTYKGVMNLIDLMGYRNLLHLKEYWENRDPSSAHYGKFLLSDISEVLDIGKVETLNFVEFNKDIKFNDHFRKTGFLALTYEFTRESGRFDAGGLPIIEATTDFTFNEMFFKLNGLRRKLENEMLPTNVIIKDVIGEFLYIEKYQFRFWYDDVDIKSIQVGSDISILQHPTTPLNIRPLDPFYPLGDPGLSHTPEYVFNKTGVGPYDNVSNTQMQNRVDEILKYYTTGKSLAGTKNAFDERPWEQGDDFSDKTGCPVVLEFWMPDVSIAKLYSVIPDEITEYWTGENIKYFNIYELEWEITKPAPNSFRYKKRGTLNELKTIGLTLPFEGEYTVKVRAFDFHGGVTIRYHKLVVQPKRPDVIALYRVPDIFENNIENFNKINIESTWNTMAVESYINVIKPAINLQRLRQQLLQYSIYHEHINNVKIKNRFTGEFETFIQSNHPRKNQWGFNKNVYWSIDDFSTATGNDLYFLRADDTYLRDDFLPGFRFTNPLPGDFIYYMTPKDEPELGYGKYEIPSFTTLEELSQIMNESTHPGVSQFDYRVVNDEIYATSKVLTTKSLMIIDYETQGSPGISGDKYTFFPPSWIINDEKELKLKQEYPDFDKRSLFLFAPFKDHLNGLVHNPKYWNNYIKLLPGDVDGYLPSLFSESYFSPNKIKASDMGFIVPRFNLVFFVVNNSFYTNDTVWTLTESYGEQREIISIRNTPFFAWRMDQIGVFDLTVRVIDGHRNEHSYTYKEAIHVLNQKDYREKIEYEIDKQYTTLY